MITPRPPISRRQWPMAFVLPILLALSSPPAHADDEPVPREVQFAVDRGLEWLAKAQRSNGSWGENPAGGTATAATTSLATMAFMARGYTPGQGPYGENVSRGIDAILALQARDGLISQTNQSPAMYDHGISTVALCEAYGMLDERRQALARTAIARAVRVILDAQAVPKNLDDQGGWRYTPQSQNSDTSVSGWQLMALRGASNIGANLPPKAIDDGIAYIKRRYVAPTGFAYTGTGGVNIALTGTGILALSLMGEPNAPEVRASADYLLANANGQSFSRSSHYYYTIYYVSQAAWQLGGNYWTAISQRLNADILSRRRADGSWDGEVNPSYCTAMALLALSVPYRYLPIYQR
jgi:hypothetical protein